MRALLSGAVCLLLLEGVARLAMAHLPLEHSYDVPRNPNNLRGWPEYTAPRPRPEGQRLAVVITNSQGLFMEGDEADQCWPALLQQELRRGREGVVVANWAMIHNKALEMMVMAARAAQHRPDVVVWVTGLENFTFLIEAVEDSASDLTRLLADPDVRRRLPAWYLERYSRLRAYPWLRARSGLVAAGSRWGEARTQIWNWTKQDRRRPVTFEVPPRWQPDSDPLLAGFIDVLRAEQPGLPVVMVNMAICNQFWPDDGYERLKEFPSRVQAALGGRPVTWLDALDLIPCEDFYKGIHFKPSGNAAFARWLAPAVEQALAGGGGP